MPKSKCSICSQLKKSDYIFNKGGWDEVQRFPAAFDKLKKIKQLNDKTYTSRPHSILQCPECSKYYYHRVDYEYDVGGTEDEEYLYKISIKEAKDRLKTKHMRT